MKEKLKHEPPGGAEVSDVNTEDETSLHVSIDCLFVTLTTTVNWLVRKLVTAKLNRQLLLSHLMVIKEDGNQMPWHAGVMELYYFSGADFQVT